MPESKLTMHRYQERKDFWHIREFLHRVFLLNDRRERAWQAYRFDYWRWHGVENLDQGPLEQTVFVWDTVEERIGAVLNPEGRGSAFLQVHPAYRSAELEEEMIQVAEEHLAVSHSNELRRLWAFAHDDDDLRQGILTRRGYARCSHAEHHHRRPISTPWSDRELAPGFTVRGLGGVEDLPSRSLASWRAFHPGEPVEGHDAWDWYRNIQRAPLYRRDLDIVAVAADGEIVSFCTVWFDEVTRTGAFEPVGTVPEHQGRGLARAVILEGLERLRRIGATMAYVGSESTEAHAFYTSIGFEEYEVARPWEKGL